MVEGRPTQRMAVNRSMRPEACDSLAFRRQVQFSSNRTVLGQQQCNALLIVIYLLGSVDQDDLISEKIVKCHIL